MRSIQALLLTLALSPLAAAQSFNCKLAQSPREHAVCTGRKLSVLDNQVASAYKSLRAQLSPESAALVQSDQREWLNWLDLVCPEHGKGVASNIYNCLGPQYTNRLRDLKQVTRIGTTVFFTRAHFVYKPADKSYEPLADDDPGFGAGSVRWPQIDIPSGHPDPVQTQWNMDVRVRAFQNAAVMRNTGKPLAFDESIAPGGTADGFYNLAAANDQIIEVDFYDSTYGYGAARPETTYNSYAWWLNRHRELWIADIFVLDSGWQKKLGALAVLNLQSQPRLTDQLDGTALNQWLAGGPGQFGNAPYNWIVSRGGITITFAQNSLGPYALGLPEAYVRWEDLKPFLAKGFDPAILPVRLPKPTP